jgi:hypothetical protein
MEQKSTKSTSPFRIGKSLSPKKSPKNFFVLTFNQINELSKIFLKNILDDNSFINEMYPILTGVLTKDFENNSNFKIKDGMVEYVNDLNQFQYNISIPDLSKILKIMAQRYNEITGDGEKNFQKKAQEEIGVLFENMLNILETNLKIPVILDEDGDDYFIFKVDRSALNKTNVGFFEQFVDKGSLSSLFYLFYIKNKNENACIPVMQLDEIIDQIKITQQAYPFRYYPSYHKVHRLKPYADDLERFVWATLTILFEDGLSEIIINEQGKLSLGKFEKLFMDCLEKTDKRFIVSFISYRTPNCGHVNILVYDRELNEIERFEPNGSIFYQDKDCNAQKADEILSDYFSKLGIKYIPPIDFCPNFGVQYKYENDSKEEREFCVTWSFLYANERLLHPELSRKDIVEKMEERLGKKIETYGSYTKYLNDRIKQILAFSKNEIIDKINSELGTKFYLDGRTLTVKY